MNKKELISSIAEKTGLTKKDTALALEGTIEAIMDALYAGEPVKITGFGVFETVERAERVGRNPQTQEEIIIPAKKSPKFRPFRELKDAVKGEL